MKQKARYFKNNFRPLIRKFVGDKSYISSDEGKTWSESGNSAVGIQKLCFYTELFDFKEKED